MSRTGLALDRVDLRRGTLCDIGLLGLLRCTKAAGVLHEEHRSGHGQETKESQRIFYRLSRYFTGRRKVGVGGGTMTEIVTIHREGRWLKERDIYVNTTVCEYVMDIFCLCTTPLLHLGPSVDFLPLYGTI